MALARATILGYSGPGRDGNEEVLYIQIQHHWNLTIRSFSVIYQDIRYGRVSHLSRCAVSVFCSSSQLGKRRFWFSLTVFNLCVCWGADNYVDSANFYKESEVKEIRKGWRREEIEYERATFCLFYPPPHILQPNGQHCHTRRSLSETSRQIHLPRK